MKTASRPGGIQNNTTVSATGSWSIRRLAYYVMRPFRRWSSPVSEETLKSSETDTYVKPGDPGHNAGKEVVWERWEKKRTFVRALEGTYGEVYKSLYAQPRIYSHGDWKWKGGPQNYGKKIVNPQSVEIAQSIEMPSRLLLAGRPRPEAWPHEFGGVLLPQGQRPRRP